MITQLSIRGLAIIEELHIDFSQRLNVITGETGAGKSILIKALHFLLGAKSDPDVIRQGFAKAHVSAAFLLPKNHSCLQILEEHGIWYDPLDFAQLIIRREIAQKGRSQAWVNDQMITQALLKEIGATLIDIYGQHENHRMLDAHSHLEFIDEFIEDPSVKLRLQSLMQQSHQLIVDMRRRLESYLARRRERDYLQFRFKELAQFNPSQEDYDQVLNACEQSDKLLSRRKILDQAQRICDEGFNGKSISRALQELQRLLEQVSNDLSDSALQANLMVLKDTAGNLDELSFALGRVISKTDIDEESIEGLQARLAGYQALIRKFTARGIQELTDEYARLDREIKLVQQGPEEIAELLQNVRERLIEADKLAVKLSKARRAASENAIQAIARELHDLNMKGARIGFDFLDIQNIVPALEISDLDPDLFADWSACAEILSKTSKQGQERGQFLLSANPGEGLKPLAKVASGGEISRIMLGFKKVLAMGANTCVMVFDEIDTGISGHTAHIVGKKLKELSSKFQVICISHLPQVAAYGDAHFLVEKAQKGETTESRILKLNRKASEEEIARLLSGDQVTNSSLTHARQLIKSAREQL